MNITRKFSIFLPVRNGGHYFKSCVTSILNQTNRNFDLIVLDNASMDGSLEWIYALDDPRITIYESEKYLSIEENWARIASVPKNEFMTMIGHDDLLDENYLDIMAKLIDIHPNASLYQAHFRLIDENDTLIRSCKPMSEIETADAFLSSRLSSQRDSFGTGYMFRSINYEKVGGIPNYKKLLFADDALWILLMMDSYKATAQDECFSYRMHAQSTSHSVDWCSAFDALADYLVFLKKCTLYDKKISKVLETKLSDYILGWVNFAFTKSYQGFEKKMIKSEVDRLIPVVNNILNSEQKKEFIATVNKCFFGYRNNFRWYILRYKHRVKNILIKIKKYFHKL